MKSYELSISRMRALCEFIFALVAVIWLLLLPGSPFS